MSETTTTTAPTTTTTTAPAPWYQGVAGVDEHFIGHLQNRGLADKPLAEIAVNLGKAHIEATKLIGVPADQVVRLPKDASDEAGTAALWSRLGKPADAKGYDLSAVKFADGSALDPAFVEGFQAAAHALHMPAEMAKGMAAHVAKFLESSELAEATEKAGALALEKTELAKNWGPNAEANLFVAKQAAKTLGIAPEAVTALEGVVGYAKVMEMFRSLGMKMGEGKYISAGGGTDGVMTREAAVARKAELMADKAWTAAYLAGDAAKAREMTALNTMIVNASQ